jgi:hypothetical protein
MLVRRFSSRLTTKKPPYQRCNPSILKSIREQAVSHRPLRTQSTMAIEENDRRYPLKRPKNHKIPVPRWTLKLPENITHIYTLYIGVQSHNQSSTTNAERSMQDWLNEDQGKPIAVDTFRVTNGFDIVNSRVWVAYWTDNNAFESKLTSLDLVRTWNDFGNDKQSIGLWEEHFTTPIDRLETNYASLLHQPGIAQIPGGEFPEHNLTAYWGAGRDRLPAAANDLFLVPDETPEPNEEPKGFGEYLSGSNYDNMCHIRKSPPPTIVPGRLY